MQAQLGVLWMYVDIVGKPAHAAYMTSGVSPLDAGLRAIATVKTLEHEWNLPENRHPAFRKHKHPINFNVGQLHAGEWNSSVPSVCEVGLRIACYPGTEIADLKRIIEARIRASLDQVSGDDLKVSFRYEGFHAPGCEYDLDTEPLQLLASTHREISGAAPGRLALTGTTDGRHFHKVLDVPVTCYGPMTKNIHGFDECVSIESMTRVATVFAQFLASWCGVEPLA